MQFYPFTLPVGAAFSLHAKGNFIRYYDCTVGAASPTLRVRPQGAGGSGGSEFLLRPGQSAKLPASAPGFSIENFDAALTIGGRLLVGDGDFNDSVISGVVTVSGNVSIVQGQPTNSVGGGINSNVVGVASGGVTASALKRRVVFRARDSNTADICISINTATMLSPIRLAPGESWIEAISPSNVWNAIAGAAAQNLDWWTDA